MAQKKQQVRRTKGGSPIRKVEVLGNGTGPNGTDVPTKRQYAEVKARNGSTYMIPVDSNGYVPQVALYERFLDTENGSRDLDVKRRVNTDLKTPATKIRSPRNGKAYTPEEVLPWWQAVNESDLLGVDDSTSSILREYRNTRSGARSAMDRIAIVAPEGRQQHIHDVIQSSFTNAELKRMTNQGGIVILEGNPGKGNDGVYYGRQPNINTPQIILRPGCSDETIVHEMVHFARQEDEKRRGITNFVYLPMDENRIQIHNGISKKEFKDRRNLEESATETEAILRTAGAHPASGYYYYTHGRKGRMSTPEADGLYREDMEMLQSGGKPMKGSNATRRVENAYHGTHISTLQYKGGIPARDAAIAAYGKPKGPVKTPQGRPVQRRGPTPDGKYIDHMRNGYSVVAMYEDGGKYYVAASDGARPGYFWFGDYDPITGLSGGSSIFGRMPAEDIIGFSMGKTLVYGDTPGYAMSSASPAPKKKPAKKPTTKKEPSKASAKKKPTPKKKPVAGGSSSRKFPARKPSKKPAPKKAPAKMPVASNARKPSPKKPTAKKPLKKASAGKGSR